jgi:hypothetical protein
MERSEIRDTIRKTRISLSLHPGYANANMTVIPAQAGIQPSKQYDAGFPLARE